MTTDTAFANPAHILIVDDDLEIRRLLSNSLADHGFQVSVAANTREMDQRLRAASVDLIVLDIMMPGESGIDACRRIGRAGGPPIVFLSALGEEGDRIVGLETGASHYLHKPCSPREIVATVRAALRSRQVAELAGAQSLRFGGWKMVTRVLAVMLAGVLAVQFADFVLLQAVPLPRPPVFTVAQVAEALTRGTAPTDELRFSEPIAPAIESGRAASPGAGAGASAGRSAERRPAVVRGSPGRAWQRPSRRS